MNRSAYEQEFERLGGLNWQRLCPGMEPRGIDPERDDVHPVCADSAFDVAIANKPAIRPELIDSVTFGADPAFGQAAKLPGLHEHPVAGLRGREIRGPRMPHVRDDGPTHGSVEPRDESFSSRKVG